MIGPDLGFTPKGLSIGGQWQEAADGGRLKSINPSTGEPLGEVPLASEADVDRAVRAGRKAFESDWGRMPMRERAGYLLRLADVMHAHRDELGLMDCVDSGNAAGRTNKRPFREAARVSRGGEFLASFAGPRVARSQSAHAHAATVTSLTPSGRCG